MYVFGAETDPVGQLSVYKFFVWKPKRFVNRWDDFRNARYLDLYYFIARTEKITMPVPMNLIYSRTLRIRFESRCPMCAFGSDDVSKRHHVGVRSINENGRFVNRLKIDFWRTGGWTPFASSFDFPNARPRNTNRLYYMYVVYIIYIYKFVYKSRRFLFDMK